MAFFHQNIRFLRQKLGFRSIKSWARFLDESDGKVKEYERNSFPKEDFFIKLKNKLNIDLDMLIATELNEYNYEKLFKADKSAEAGKGEHKNQAFTLLMEAKNTNDIESKDKLIDQAIISAKDMMDENVSLKEELLISIKKRESLLDRLSK